MDKEQIKDILDRYSNGICTEEEKIFVENWYHQKFSTAERFDSDADVRRLKERVYQNLQSYEKEHRPAKTFRLRTLSAAAAVLFLVALAAGGYYALRNYRYGQHGVYAAREIQPGGNRATLTLADGRVVKLDSAMAGTIASQQGGIQVKMTKNGQIVYQADARVAASAGATNQIATPRGGQYQIILPDGTKVWLNAASKLIYPISFNGRGERDVKLTGEAYFEVSKDPNKPFKVISGDHEILVLGTHFNVSCYDNEDIKTTLAEGSVRILQPSKNRMQNLVPGQQSIANQNGITVKQVNADDITAWKDGLFVFSQTDIKSVLQQLSRWYDVEIDYSNLKSNRSFDAEIPRNLPLSKVLQSITLITKIQFQIEGRRVIIK